MPPHIKTISVWLVAITIFCCAQIFAMPLSGIAKSLKQMSDESGKVTLEFKKPKDKKFEFIKKMAEESSALKDSIEIINNKFILPDDITITFQEGEGPYFDTGTHELVMSYDFIDYLIGLYMKQYPYADNKTLKYFTLDTTQFFLYHEIAHALIDLYHIPIVSNEETAADNLAVIIALEYMDDGFDVVMNSAELFDLFDRDNEKYDEDELWDEHALDSQRFYNVICLTYGKFPEKVKAEAKKNDSKVLLTFIEARGDYCIVEYERQLKNWGRLLEHHLK